MSLKVLIDMNLSPEWVNEMASHGVDAVHWTSVGDPRAPDVEMMAWARAHGHVVLTNDLDFGTTLALTHANGPSVLQVRRRNALPEAMGSIVLTALRQFEDALASGALIVIDGGNLRVRVLPLSGN